MDIDEDDLEIVNDDGFVFKRKKRRVDPTPLTTSSAPPPPSSDPSIEEKNRRKRKKKALIKLKDKYQKELCQWEHLSNTLKDMQLKSETLSQTRQVHAPTHNDSSTCNIPDNAFSGRVLDELLVQVEAQGEIIQDASNMCDLVEALCNAEEEKLKRSLIELPIWDYSPQELMASLCEE